MTAAAAVSVARWASRRFANRGQTVRLRVKTARAARRRSAFANSFRRCGTPDSASPQPAGINIGKRRLCPCGCQPHRMDGLHFRLCPGALGDQPVMLDAAMLVEIALDLVAELEVEGCGDDLVILAEGAAGDLAGRRDDDRAADQAVGLDQDRGVVMAGLAVLLGQSDPSGQNAARAITTPL